jgi:hypothetical protein
MSNKIENWNKPRNRCFFFFMENNIKNPKLLNKQKFDENLKNFKNGPYKDDFGCEYGEPYNPWVQAFGILNDGSGVFCELNEVI